MSKSLHRIEYHRQSVRELVDDLYANSLFNDSIRPSFRRNNLMAKWALDLRRPLSVTKFLAPTALAFLDVMTELGVNQVAGKGLGAFPLVGAIVARGKDIKGCMIRESRKQYGFREIIEGGVDRCEPLVLVDDLLASGRTLASAAETLRNEGYKPIAALSVFRFGWQPGHTRLFYAGLQSLSLATLHYSSYSQTPAASTWEAPAVYRVNRTK